MEIRGNIYIHNIIKYAKIEKVKSISLEKNTYG